MSALYDLLKKKAEDSETRDQILYAEMPETIENSDYSRFLGFTYLEFYKLVNIYIKKFEKEGLKRGSVKFICVDNSVASNALILAARECGLRTVLIDSLFRRALKDLNVPMIYGDDDFNGQTVDERAMLTIESAISYLQRDIKGDIIICSSGSEGVPHFEGFTEEQLLNIKNQYGTDKSTFYSYISSANISGLLTNIVNPLLHDCDVVMRTGFDLGVFDRTNRGSKGMIFDRRYLLSTRNPKLAYDIFYGKWDNEILKIEGNQLVVGRYVSFDPYRRFPIYKQLDLQIGSLDDFGITIDAVMFPRDIVRHLENYDCSRLNFNSVINIYLAGGVNPGKMIDKIREKLTIPACSLTNLYGATEAGGVIVTCNEQNLRPCYIDASNSLNGELVYTFDKINFFSITKEGVKKVNKKFDEGLYMEFLPVSDSETSNVTINDDFTIVFSNVEGTKQIESTDIGAIIEGQLYVVGRKSSLTRISGKNYFLNSVEDQLSRVLGVDIYCLPSEDRKKISVFANCENKDINYKINIYYKILDFCSQQGIPFDYPVILDEESFPRIETSGKISRKQFEEYRKYASVQYSNVTDRDESKQRMLNRIIVGLWRHYGCLRSGDFRVRIYTRDRYFFDFGYVLRFFDVISFDDIKGEIELRFNDNYMFDITRSNIIFEYPTLAGECMRDELLEKMVSEGVDDYTASMLLTNNSTVYKALHSGMRNEEIFRQLRLNIVASICSEIPESVHPCILKGAKRISEELTLSPFRKEEYNIEMIRSILGLAKDKQIVVKMTEEQKRLINRTFYCFGLPERDD